MEPLISDLPRNASFLDGFPLQSNPAANKQAANTMPATTSTIVITVSCRAVRLVEVVMSAAKPQKTRVPSATGAEPECLC